MKILISGAGIAGPALAHELEGHEVTVVERAPSLRTGGQAVDFRGPVHREVLERMKLWDDIHRHRTPGNDLVIVGEDGREKTRMPSVMISGDVEIVRGDLVALLYERTRTRVAYRFGDHVTALAQDAAGVAVRFRSGNSERFDIVVGADGLHSGVRALALTPEERCVRAHGYKLATMSVPIAVPDAQMYTEPGRSLMLARESPTRSRAQLIWHRDLGLVPGEVYAGMGWRVPEVLAALEQASDLYVDEICTVHLDRYARGRVVLLGDAAWGGTLGGQGTSLGIVGAHVLAHELAVDPEQAFARFETRMRPYATECQKGAMRVGQFFAPRSAAGVWLRNAMYALLTSRLFIKQFEKLVKASATGFELPQYG